MMRINTRSFRSRNVFWMRVQENSSVYVLVLANKLKKDAKSLLVVAFLAFILLCCITFLLPSKHKGFDLCVDDNKWLNLNPWKYEVPNILHFYRKDANNISMTELACFNAAQRIQNGKTFVHSQDPNGIKKALQRQTLFDSSKIVILNLPLDVDKSSAPHRILKEYGGIFLKNDIYLVRPLHELRLYDKVSVGNHDIMIATKEAAISTKQWKFLNYPLFDKDWGALYILEVMKICSVKAIRMGDRTRRT